MFIVLCLLLIDGNNKYQQGSTGRYLGHREGGLVAVELSLDVSVLVDEEYIAAVPWVRLPGNYNFDTTNNKSVKTKSVASYVTYTDTDGDEIVFSGYEGSGRCSYSVNHSYRPECLSAEFFMSGREDWSFPHVRLYNSSSQYKNVPLPSKEDIGCLISLINDCGVPHNMRKFNPGESVSLLNDMRFQEGDEIPRSSHAKILQKSELTPSDAYEVCVANGDRVDVPTVWLMPAPIITRGDTVFLHREVTFQSKRDPIKIHSQLSIASRGDKGM